MPQHPGKKSPGEIAENMGLKEESMPDDEMADVDTSKPGNDMPRKTRDDDEAMEEVGGSVSDVDITENREANFDIETGQFRDPDTGMFEVGGPPPDLDLTVDRFRAKDGKFKESSADLFDEELEALTGDLDHEG